MKKVLLSLSLVTVALAGKAQNCSDLFISEYVEGGGNNKAMEFYNPTNSAINLSNYRLVRYSNGSATPVDSTDLIGTINPNGTHVICNGTGVTSPTTATSPGVSPALLAVSNQTDHAYPNPTAMNGDDALTLVKISPYKILDIFGKIGEQPATAWSDVAPYDGTAGKWWTKDHSMQRKSSVQTGVMSNPASFNPTLQWDSLPKDNFSNLGMHTCGCLVGVNEYNKDLIALKVFPNPSNGGDMTVISDKEIKSVVIINALGQTVINHVATISEKKVVLKQTGLAKGIYYVEIKTEVGNRTEKLVIQ